MCLTGAAGCSEEVVNTEPRPVVGELRIASLSPAMTTMIIDLGLRESLVGRTPYCRDVDPNLPVVGALDGIDAEILLGCTPNLVVVQPSIGGVDPALTALAKEEGWVLVAQHLNTLADIRTALASLSVAIPDESARLRSAAIQSRIEAMMAVDVSVTAPDVALVYSLDPCGVVGKGTYLDEVLKAAGGTNALPLTGWLELSFEDLLRRDPDLVIFLGTSGVERLESLPWNPKTRVATFDNPSALEPSTRAPNVMQQLADIIEEHTR